MTDPRYLHKTDLVRFLALAKEVQHEVSELNDEPEAEERSLPSVHFDWWEMN